MARTLERRLERLVGLFAGRVFSGRVHPVEIVTRLAREADFARFEHPSGPATANSYRLLLNPKMLAGDPKDLEYALTEELENYAAHEGLRLQGPARVTIGTSEKVSAGSVECDSEVVAGNPPAWAELVTAQETIQVRHNRALIGRSEDADIRLNHDDVSRVHALVWRHGGKFFLRDLQSANGTTLDGRDVGNEPTVFETGAIIGLASHRYRFVTV